MSEYTGTRAASDYRAQKRARKKIIDKAQRKLARIRDVAARKGYGKGPIEADDRSQRSIREIRESLSIEVPHSGRIIKGI